MNSMPILDLGWALIAYVGGSIALLCVAFCTYVVEALVIRRFLHLSFWRSTLDALAMNFLSGFLGFVAVFLVPSAFGLDWTNGRTFGASYDLATPKAVAALYFTMMAIFCLASIAIEGVVLSLIEWKSPLSTIWLIALLSNLTSYLGLFVVLMILSIPYV